MNIKLAWRNIWRNKRRTLITLASIAFAVFFASIMQSMQLGTYDSMIRNSVSFYSGYAQVHKKGYWEEKSLENAMEWDREMDNKLNDLPNVINTVPRIQSFSLVSFQEKTKASMILGIDPTMENMLTKVADNIIDGRYLKNKDKGVLIGSGLAAYLSVSLGDSVAMIGQGYHGVNAVGKYPVVGIFKTPIAGFNDQTAYMSLPEAQYYFGFDNQITSLTINVREGADLDNIKKLVSQAVDNPNIETMVWQEMMPELVQQIKLDYASGKIILYVLYMIIGFGMFGTFLMMAKERTYEFGMLMAIGMKRFKLKSLALLELFLLSLAGVVAGGLLSFPLMAYLHFNPIPLTGEFAKMYEDFGIEPVINFSISPVILTNQTITILIIALVLSIYPVWFIHKLKVASAIRH